MSNFYREGLSFEVGKPSRGIGALTPDAAQQLGPKAVELQKKEAAAVKLPQVKLANSYKPKGKIVKEAHYNPTTGKIQAEKPSEEEINTLAKKAAASGPKKRKPVGSVRKNSATFKPSSPEQAKADMKSWSSYWGGNEEVENSYECVIEALVEYGFAEDEETANDMIIGLSEGFIGMIFEEYLEEKARGTRKKTTSHMYDMDETLFGHDHSKVNVHVHNEKGERTHSLSNQEFNTHKLPKGHSYNFDEFRSSKVFGKSAKPLKKMIRHLNRQKARGYDTHIVTARSDMDDQPAFAKHLSKYGININPGEKGEGHVHVHRTGNLEGSDVGVKKRDTLQGLAQKHGYKKIHMYDDAAKVHKAVQNTPGVEVKTHMVKPRGKSGEVRARPFRATETQQKPINADFEMWVDGLLTEGYDLSNYTWNELAEYFTEAIIAVAAPADEPNNNRPIKKYPPNKPYPFFNFTTNSKKEKSKIKKEEADMSFYEYWKEFIDEGKVNEESKPPNQVLSYKNYQSGVLNKDTGKFTQRAHSDKEQQRYGWKPVKVSSYSKADTPGPKTASGHKFDDKQRLVAVPYKYKENEVPKGVWKGTPSTPFGTKLDLTAKPMGTATKVAKTSVQDTGNFGRAGDTNKEVKMDLSLRTSKDLAPVSTSNEFGKRMVYAKVSPSGNTGKKL